MYFSACSNAAGDRIFPVRMMSSWKKLMPPVAYHRRARDGSSSAPFCGMLYALTFSLGPMAKPPSGKSVFVPGKSPVSMSEHPAARSNAG